MANCCFIPHLSLGRASASAACGSFAKCGPWMHAPAQQQPPCHGSSKTRTAAQTAPQMPWHNTHSSRVATAALAGAVLQPHVQQHDLQQARAVAVEQCSTPLASLAAHGSSSKQRHIRRIRGHHSSISSICLPEQELHPSAAQVLAQQAAVIAAAAAVLPPQPPLPRVSLGPIVSVQPQAAQTAVEQQQQEPVHQAQADGPLQQEPECKPAQQQQQQQQQQLPLLSSVQPHEYSTPLPTHLHTPAGLMRRHSSALIDVLAPVGLPAPAALPTPVDPQAPVDPSALCIADRVRVLVNNAVARKRTSKKVAHVGAPTNVLQYCAAAGVSDVASSLLLKHVKATRISGQADVLGPYVASYKRLAEAYGEPVVLDWLRKAPPIIRMEEEVPARLAELRMHMGPSATPSDVLALTKRCPQVLQVSRAVLGMRMMHLCRMLGKNPDIEAGVLLVAAPALLAMQPHTLERKLQQLQALANTHSSWAQAYRSCPTKSLAVLLTYSLERQLRLHYAAAHGLQDKLQMNTVMAWSKRDWLKAHPRFEEWCQAYKRSQQQQQQQPGELPSPERQLSRQQQVALLQQIH